MDTMADRSRRHSRRAFLGAALGMLVALAATDRRGAVAQGKELLPTPACEGGRPTAPQTAGPYFKPRSPRRTSLVEPGMTGARLVVTGLVLSTNCRPIAGALLDFWQADDRGEYDNAGYRFRGHQLTDDSGHYRLETVVPGNYPGRTRHIHVKVQAPGQPALTTQLYFPAEPGNQRDGIFDPALVMKMEDTTTGKVGTFDFVLAVPSRS
jgi:protocatechuate 3,4-dioxygenase beta subunit